MRRLDAGNYWRRPIKNWSHILPVSEERTTQPSQPFSVSRSDDLGVFETWSGSANINSLQRSLEHIHKNTVGTVTDGMNVLGETV